MYSISVLLIGAGGAFGQPLLQEFIRQRCSFKRIAVLAANEEKATKLAATREDGVEVVMGSFREAPSYAGFTHVVSAVGNALMKCQTEMIDAAIKAGVTHFYASEWNSDISQPEISGMRYFRDKQLVRAHLAARARENPPFKYTLFITGIFTEWSVLEFYGFDHENFTAEIYGTPEARVGVTSIPDIARYTASSLLVPFASTNPTNPSERTIRVCGSSQPFSALVAALSKARGRECTATYLDPAEAAEKQDEARHAGDELGEMMWSIRPLVASGYGVADGDGSGRLDNELFGFTPETVEETFRRVYTASNANQ